MAYYKMRGNHSLTIWSGSMWIPSIKVYSAWDKVRVKVSNILLGTNKRRDFFLQNIDPFESLAEAANTIEAKCSTIEEVKYLLENGSLRYLGEYNLILEKK